MGLETATYIEDLVVSNPLGTDSKAQGDNHLRLIKNVLKNQFPNLGQDAITTTAVDLNDLFDNNRAVPTGFIGMWSGTTATVPTGWAICDGTNGTPNLVNKFIVGSSTDVGGTYDIGDAGGSADITIASATDSHVLTIAEMPSHVHNNITRSTDGSPANYLDGVVGGGTSGAVNTEATGGGGGHTHGITYDGSGANIPPYYSLAYIMKL